MQETQNTQESRARVLWGNASVDGAHHQGWFFGHFLEHAHDLRSTQTVEVKWSRHKAGEEKPQWKMTQQVVTLCVLIKGIVFIRFPWTECILAHEGDYVIWSADLPHRLTVVEDALILTIRWP
jgi:hypothetical protein